jgi:hypothetical protein
VGLEIHQTTPWAESLEINSAVLLAQQTQGLAAAEGVAGPATGPAALVPGPIWPPLASMEPVVVVVTDIVDRLSTKLMVQTGEKGCSSSSGMPTTKVNR